MFGCGHPLLFPLSVALGVDFFDSAAYALFARDDRILTPEGTVKIQGLNEWPVTSSALFGKTPKMVLEMSKDPAANLVLGGAVVLDSRIRAPAQLSLQEWVLFVEHDVEPFLWSGKHMLGSEVVSGRANNSVVGRDRLLLPTPLILG